VSVHRSNVGRLLQRLGLSHKKPLQASEQQRADVRQARELWMGRRKRFFNKALAPDLDRTSINTKLTKTHWLGAEERALQGSLQTASTTKFFKDLVERP
jgi:hypothetical protein